MLIRMTIIKVLLAVAILIQLVPYGHSHTNPPVTQEPPWDSPQTRDLFRRACFDCHSNLTTWPWYSNVAPVSWLLQHDVDEGRSDLNFTEWDKDQHRVKNVAREVRGGDMPPWYYLPMHPMAKLTDAEKQALIAGGNNSFQSQLPGGKR